MERGVCGLVAGVVGGGLGLLGGHERNKNIVGVLVSRLAWVGGGCAGVGVAWVGLDGGLEWLACGAWFTVPKLTGNDDVPRHRSALKRTGIMCGLVLD